MRLPPTGSDSRRMEMGIVTRRSLHRAPCSAWYRRRPPVTEATNASFRVRAHGRARRLQVGELDLEHVQVAAEAPRRMIGDSVSDTGITNRPSELAVARTSRVDRTGWRTVGAWPVGTIRPTPPRAVETMRAHRADQCLAGELRTAGHRFGTYVLDRHHRLRVSGVSSKSRNAQLHCHRRRRSASGGPSAPVPPGRPPAPRSGSWPQRTAGSNSGHRLRAGRTRRPSRGVCGCGASIRRRWMDRSSSQSTHRGVANRPGGAHRALAEPWRQAGGPVEAGRQHLQVGTGVQPRHRRRWSTAAPDRAPCSRPTRPVCRMNCSS